MKQSYKVKFFLQIFSSTTPLSLYLQTKGLDIFQAYKMVKQTTNTVNEQSLNFENILEASNTFTEWANMTFNDRHLGLNKPREQCELKVLRGPGQIKNVFSSFLFYTLHNHSKFIYI